ncbi:MAG: SdrD B-like domain-containing protein, partial [Acidiferrobacterales bacterium]|nr:SdrD B-like domain-containing protein [Acidiferrobacterales bacterium]
AVTDTPRQPTDESPQATPYVDKLIDPSIADQPAAEEVQAPKGLGRYGPGSVGIEYGYYRSKATGDADRTTTENGLGITFRQATPNFGLLDFQAAVTNQTNDPEPDVGSGDALRLIQTDLPLTGNWFMDNLLGQIHAPAPASVAISYRLRLPAPLISGLATRVLHGNTTVGAAAGDLGILRGRTFPVFESTTGSVTGVAATHRFNARWQGGLQLWDVKDALVGTRLDSHTSFAGAVEYRDPVAKQFGQLHLLSNGGGSNGLWLDGETIRGRWQHNYGAFRLDPDLVWIDNTYAIPTDQQGTYWNGVYRTFRWSVRGGADFLETNLDHDPQLTGRKTTNLFANVAYRLNPRLNIDGALRLGRQRAGAGLPSEDSDTISARTTVSYRLGTGTSFWTLGVTDFDNDISPSTVSEFIWDYEWRIPQTRLRTGVEYQRDAQSLDTLSETLLRVIASRRFFDSRLGLNAIFTAGVAGGGATEEGRTSSLGLNLDWRVNRALELRLDLTQNRNVVELVGGNETRVTERSVLLSVAYQFGWNSTRTTIGRGSGQRGQGRIAGTVFLDANRNGIQEPDEAGVPNVTVYLDRGFSVTTDARGRFEFWPVPAGDHALQIALDNVPLPWGLVDERPRQVEVVPRDATQLDYGLTRINE